MAYKDYTPSKQLKQFEQENGEDTFIKLNLLYIAFELNEVYDEESDGGEFDDLCEDVLELSLDEAFESFNLINIADAVVFIIHDSNYTVAEYEKTYKSRRDKVSEELLAYLKKERAAAARADED